MTTPIEGLHRLRRAAASGELAALCERYGLDLLVVFGSTAKGKAEPRDLDIAVSTRRGRSRLALLDLYEALTAVTGPCDIDVMVLDRADPVARREALLGTIPIYEHTPGRFAEVRMAALNQYAETAPMRALSLEMMTR
ncbi:nucleotidyltransferase family protein [Glycomyces buryatensis]|uniref:Nucleotidyltransferase domain-containing protein n=1 Tax=Glycomyces buryatensis TaxID=2570927 RepID=A0A4S8QJN3_9ACTN|nr:nucleotidyltransferase domain-containing protein [Glycomyces buryatensis]THV40944.1 nucleotidyltransferase domain-containing protein [Glycomyces buryatensis]